MTELETCPDCQARLPKLDGPTHRYLGASPACWALYTALHNGGEPPLTPMPSNVLLVDAYAAQHPGVPSPQAIQSVAVHLLTLYGILERGVGLDKALWLRRRALREEQELGPKHSRFTWLTPPDFSGSLTIADIVAGPTPQARAERVQQYSQIVWARWSELHLATLSTWYERYVL